jgi:hypothetical protein
MSLLPSRVRVLQGVPAAGGLNGRVSIATPEEFASPDDFLDAIVSGEYGSGYAQMWYAPLPVNLSAMSHFFVGTKLVWFLRGKPFFVI